MGWGGGERILKKRTNFPKIMTYISPTLLFSIQTHLLLKKTFEDQFSLSSPIHIGPITRSFPIGRYCKLDTGMQQPKLHPELQMQQKLQVDLLLGLVNFTSLVPTWHGASSQVDHTLNWSTSTAPLNNLQNSSQSKCIDMRS